MKNQIIFVTGNFHKAKEAQEILKNVKVVTKQFDLVEIQGTPEEIILAKVKEAKDEKH